MYLKTLTKKLKKYKAEYVDENDGFDVEAVLMPTDNGNQLVVSLNDGLLRVDIMNDAGTALKGSIFLDTDPDKAVFSLKNLVPLV